MWVIMPHGGTEQREQTTLNGMVVGGLLAIVTAPALAIDGSHWSRPGRQHDMGRVAVQWTEERWLETSNWHVAGIGSRRRLLALEQHAARSERRDRRNRLTPVLRFQANDLKGPYVEAASAFISLSRTQIGSKRFSTMFQFGDIWAWAIASARKAHSMWATTTTPLDRQHQETQQRINFHQVRLQYHF